MHQAVCPGSKSTQVEEIKIAILLVIEALLPIVAAVDEVHRDTRQHDARTSRHDNKNGRHTLPLTKNVVCP